MKCPNCGASISENEEKCPYCDSFLDHKKKAASVEDIQNAFQKVGVPFLKDNPDDKPNAFMIDHTYRNPFVYNQSDDGAPEKCKGLLFGSIYHNVHFCIRLYHIRLF